MSSDLHHVMIFVSDIDRSLNLFQDLLGFKLQWREIIGGVEISKLVSIDDIEVEVAFLQSRANGVAVELLRLIGKNNNEKPARFGALNSVGLSIAMKDLDTLYQQLTNKGWPPFTPPQKIITPGGESARIFFFRTEDGLIIEIIESLASPDKKED
jgi:catechol 2,3-dioxygenase-like lactoylglutathione lyase family enzyme